MHIEHMDSSRGNSPKQEESKFKGVSNTELLQKLEELHNQLPDAPEEGKQPDSDTLRLAIDLDVKMRDIEQELRLRGVNS